ncbi:putative 3',5'-cyclic phosphodiesterase pde-5 [Exaiptasia diaphana]|nr:putative 3',5'-cyclic phosphodiesterase pde-5 [Exaiptasia diaphana]
MNSHLIQMPQEFKSWDFDIYQDDDTLTHYFVNMTREVFEICQVRVDFDTIVRFTIMVRKSYRNIPYHNWAHAFSVSHSIYVMLRKNDSIPNIEKLFLYIAGVIHDVDHRGKSNAFMLQSNTPLANLYTTSTMEWHHFHQGIFILERDGHNVFGNLNSSDYRKVLEGIQESILATDLATFFGNKNRLEKINQDNSFCWKNEEHRSLVRRLLMTACDLCASAKPWNIQKMAVKKVFEEFYIQGDEEKQRGVEPLPMMDRNRKKELPQNQVGFLKGIVKPCYATLDEIMPDMDCMIKNIDCNISQWEKIDTRQRSQAALLIPEEERIQRSLSFIDY